MIPANLTRRNLSKGQQAIALAMIYPDTKPGKRTHGSAAADADAASATLATLFGGAAHAVSI
jgi:hypothetical protein